MPQLIAPDISRFPAWSESHGEWGAGLHEDGFGIGPDDRVDTEAGFRNWIARLEGSPERFWWIVDGDVVLGGIALRPWTDNVVLRIGHVGYGIRPSARGRGVATWALGQVLRHARSAGLDRLLLVCLDDNVGSIKTIERHGGKLHESAVSNGDVIRRYWIEL